jgi:hypothetical protein
VSDAITPLLDREEYIEQAYFFRVLGERMAQNVATQDLILSVREELLATTKLPLAIDFLATELRHSGVFATAMARLGHYFTRFQTFVMGEAEQEKGRFDIGLALAILEREAQYRAEGCSPQGVFLYQFETLCRHRLGYDRGLEAIAADSVFDDGWREWILAVRHQIGLIDIADLIYVRSALYQQRAPAGEESSKPVLFGEKEGRIALANRRRDPLYLFAAFERHLKYPAVPRPRTPDESKQVLPQLLRKVERFEVRLKLLEEEQRGGVDLTKFYGPQPPDAPAS